MGHSTKYKICATKIGTFPFYFIIYLFIRSFLNFFLSTQRKIMKMDDEKIKKNKMKWRRCREVAKN